MILKVEKRNGQYVDFDIQKIENAIYKALTFVKEGGKDEASELSEKVLAVLLRRFSKEEVPHVEEIQNVVEEVLISEGLTETARSYILYREKRREIREAASGFDESTELIEKYIDEIDWQVKENANMTYSLQGLNQYATSYISKKYWLNKIYPEKIREAAKNQDFHIHDLNLLATYCSGWDLQDLLIRGFGGVSSKVESKPPKHFRPALGQVVNFFFTLQGEGAGAQAMSNFDTLLAPFIRKDNLDYKQVKQSMQEFVFNCMVPTRVGFQTPFLNISLDVTVPEFLKKQPIIIGGEVQKETYGEFQEEMDIFNKAFYEVLMQGDAKGRVFTFPIPTVSITKEFDWENEALDNMWEATAKYGINYFSNFVQSDMNPEDFRSMCLHAEEEIFIKEDGEIKKLAIEDLFENYHGDKIDEEWFKASKHIESISLNPETGQLEWVGINKFLKITDNEIVAIETADGKTMNVSKNHLVGVFTPEGIKTKKAEDVSEDDFLLTLKDGSRALNSHFDKVDEVLSWFIGLFIADGNYLYDSRYEKKVLRGIQITFNKQEKELIEKTKKAVKEILNYEMKFISDKRYENSLCGYIYNREFAKKMKQDLMVYKYGKLPSWIWSADIKTIEAVLKGFFDGDGYEKGKEIHINDSELSKDLNLLFQMVGISTTYIKKEKSQSIRIQHVLGRGSSGEKVIKDKLHNLIPSFLIDKKFTKDDQGEKTYQVYGCKQVGLSSIYRWGISNEKIENLKKSDYAVVGVRSIKKEKLESNHSFYDIELDKNHYFVHSDGNITHNCCRLRLDNKELIKRGGGLFGSQPLTGSVGVVTINLPRIGYLSKTKEDFYKRLSEMMDLAKESLELKRKVLDNFIEKGLYPYTKHYLSSVKKMRGSYFGNHFSTIGLIGMNEALLNFMGKNIATKEGKDFALEVLTFMREKLVGYQEETDNLYNLEATPGEGTSFRQARADRERYADIITAGTKDAPYYTNSVHLPVNYTDDPFEALDLQDELQQAFTGGTVIHLFLGERVSTPQAAKNIIRKVFENYHLPYITLSPTFSICTNCGYIKGESPYCPNCKIKAPKKTIKNLKDYRSR